jgi:5-dehydro-4-deoxyglucarate dehydratase
MARSPEELRTGLRGMFAFPVTPFTTDNEVDVKRFREHLAFLIEARPAALFVCGGTGEFVSLDLEEYRGLVKAAVEEAAGRLPVIAGAGYGAKLASHFVRAAEEAGADGVLVLPPYLLHGEQEGLLNHYRAVAQATRLGMIVYQRDNAIFAPSTACRLTEIPNLVGFKDGHGDMERLTRIRLAVGDRLTFMNGMPTAELSALAFFGLGITSYSSAVFNFVPQISHAFFRALNASDMEALSRWVETFYRPLAELRERKKGYAISLIKAGVNILGKSVGKVRPPLVYPSPSEEADLKAIIEKGLAALRKN